MIALLDRRYGRKPWHPGQDPLRELISTVLSQNTSDRNSERAWQHLRQAFPTMERLAKASEDQVAEAITAGGLAQQKSRTIAAVMHAIPPQAADAYFANLEELPVPRARQQLSTIRGVGPKTASCVLLFSLGMASCPVDTHVHRVMSRIGIFNGKHTSEQCHELLESAVGGSTEDAYSLHVNTLILGRSVCKPARPQCSACALEDICDYSQRHKSTTNQRQ